jgi:hypothetical protein
MQQKHLLQPDYKHQFSGHETFPLRYGWLKKAYDTVCYEGGKVPSKVFSNDESVSRFGIGKNMVSSLRHWATVAGVLQNSEKSHVKITELGRLIFDESGADPYMEHPTTLWLIHWMLAGRTEKTTWHWAFNYFNATTFDRDQLTAAIEKFSDSNGWRRAANTTIKRDVECFVKTYVPASRSKKASLEERLESPLIELGLIKSTASSAHFQMIRGPKPTLTMGVFIFALIEFWEARSSASTLSFEAIAHEAGSPGRVFLLDEQSLSLILSKLDNFTNGVFKWSETAGLRQVVRSSELSNNLAIEYLTLDYKTSAADKERT